MSLASKVSWFFKYLQFFSGVQDVRAFSALRKSSAGSGEEVLLNVRGTPDATLICRPGTTDAEVLWDVFWGGYHLPEDDLPNTPVIFDLGANVGYSCFDFGKRFPGARVLGVELDQDNVALARRNVSALGPDCGIVHAAIWREDGEVTYSKNSEEWGYQISNEHDANDVSVRAISIDTLLQEAGVDWVDYMKIDIEGAEDEILNPDAAWLQKTGALNIEIHAPATYEKCAAALAQAGFTCERSTRHRDSILGKREKPAR